MCLSENFPDFELHLKWNIIIQKDQKLDGNVKIEEDSLGSKAMGFTCDVLKVCDKS